jgi:hypothetical protein
MTMRVLGLRRNTKTMMGMSRRGSSPKEVTWQRRSSEQRVVPMAWWAAPHQGPHFKPAHDEEMRPMSMVDGEPWKGGNRGGELTMEKGIWLVRGGVHGQDVKPFYMRLGWAIGSRADRDGGCVARLEHHHSGQWCVNAPCGVRYEWASVSGGLKASTGQVVFFV